MSYKDMNGVEWKIAFTPAYLERVAASENCKPDEVMKTIVEPFVLDLKEYTIYDTYGFLWLLFQPQAEARGISSEKEFGQIQFDLGDAFFEAMETAIVNFTRRSGRGMLREAFRKAETERQRATDITARKLAGDRRLQIDDMKLSEAIDKAMNSHLGSTHNASSLVGS